MQNAPKLTIDQIDFFAPKEISVLIFLKKFLAISEKSRTFVHENKIENYDKKKRL